MSHWYFTYYSEDEIKTLIEETLALRENVKAIKGEVERKRARTILSPPRFENVKELSDYAREAQVLNEDIEEAQARLKVAELDLNERRDALKSIIPPGSGVMYKADNGERFWITHTMRTHTSSQIYFRRPGKEREEGP